MTHIQHRHVLSSLVHNRLSLTGEGHVFDEWPVELVAGGEDLAPQEAEDPTLLRLKKDKKERGK